MRNRLFQLLLVLLVLTGAASAATRERLQADLRETITDLSGMGSRVTGYPGADRAADYLSARLRDLGVAEVHEQTFPQPIPMDQGFTLVSDGESLGMYGVWPNLVRTSTTPVAGISGDLVYGGNGSPADLDGKPIQDRIVAIEYESGFRWVGAFHLGAKAVVFLGSKHVHRKEGS